MPGMGTPSPLGAAIAKLRKSRGLSLQALTDKTGIPRSTINGLELGRQRSLALPALVRLADALGDTSGRLVRVASSLPSSRTAA